VTSISITNQHREMARLCVGCGICLGICPINTIKLETTKGALTVNFDYSRCTKCGMCNRVCPALSNFYVGDLKTLEVLGRVDKVFFAYATDNTVRYHGASGGVVTSLTLYMLRHKIIDKVLIVRMKKFAIETLLTSNEYNVLSAQGSIYFKTFSLRILQEILCLIRKGEKIGVVGLPCQISALRRVLKDFESKIYSIGLLCNHVNENWYLEYIIGKYLPKSARPIAIDSRKDGWPGEIKIRFRLNKNLKELSISQSKFWGSLPLLNISSPIGCMLCEDHLASMADITVGDAWHPKFMGRDSSGVSILIARSARGLNLIDKAVKDEVLHIEKTGLQDLLVTQGHHVIEGIRYAPLRKSLLQHRITVLRELMELDKLVVTLLVIVNRLTARFKVIRRLLGTPLAEKLLKIVLWLQHKSSAGLSLYY